MRERCSPAPVDAPAAIADSTANPTAATPSFSRLSDSTTIDTRGSQRISRNAAITDTGSVAAISTPNRAAPIQLQPTSQCIPAATTAAAMTDAREGERERQRKLVAEPAPIELQRGFEHQRRKQDVEDQLARQRQRRDHWAAARLRSPATTSPTMYGSPSRRDSIAIRQATSSRTPIGARERPVMSAA